MTSQFQATLDEIRRVADDLSEYEVATEFRSESPHRVIAIARTICEWRVVLSFKYHRRRCSISLPIGVILAVVAH